MLRLVLTSNRVSIFDFPLGFEVPRKGEMLNAFNIAARNILRDALPKVEQDLVACGAAIDEYLPSGLRGCKMLQRCAVVVGEYEMVKVECVTRSYLTGTGYRTYLERQGVVCGNELPPGLTDGSLIPVGMIYTPTTKAPQGQHDENLDHTEVEKDHPGLSAVSLTTASVLRGYAHARGVIIVDEKGEYGQRLVRMVPRRYEYVVADERMTPDCCRFWRKATADEYLKIGKLPPSMDKEILRNWGRGVRIDRLNPKSEKDRAEARNLYAPPQVVEKVVEQIHEVFEMLHEMHIDDYQRTVLNIA
jgi:phosphoribosylaminoimidazole-succinocarboxamide synthase